MQTFDLPSPDSSVWMLSLLSPDYFRGRSHITYDKTLKLNCTPSISVLFTKRWVGGILLSPFLLFLLLFSACLQSKTEAREFSRFLFVYNLTMLFLPFEKPESKQKKAANSDLCWCWQSLDLNWVCLFSCSLNSGSAVRTGAESGWSFSQTTRLCSDLLLLDPVASKGTVNHTGFFFLLFFHVRRHVGPSRRAPLVYKMPSYAGPHRNKPNKLMNQNTSRLTT